MMKNYSLKVFISSVLICLAFLANAQQININTMTPSDHPLTIPQTSTYTTNNGNGAVTVLVKNTNAFPAILDTLHYFIQGAGTQQTQLWYSATSLTGNNGGQAVSAANGWTQITSQSVNAPLANTMQPLLSGLNFVIPGNTTYRFQVIRAGLGYGGTGTWASPNAPTPDSFQNSGIVVGSARYTIGGNAQSNSVAFGQATFGFNPRSFVGKLSFTLQSTPCAGVPNHDTVIGNMNPCPGVATCYYLTGNNPNSGLTYQWLQSSISATGPWTVMVNDTNSSNCFIPPQPGPTWYTCVTTCTASMQFDTATAIMVTPATFSPYSPCYCGNSSPTIVNLGDIGQFTVGNISNPSVAPPLVTTPYVSNSYSNFDTLAPIPTFIQGQTYPVSMQAQFGPTFTYNGWTKAWIDYDHNTSWDPASEEILNSAANAPAYNASGSFTVPTTAQPGLTRLRVVYNMLGNQAGTQPCGTYNRGETEDYLVNILAASNHDPAVTNIQVVPSGGCMDSCETVIVTLSNFGSGVLDFSTDSMAVTLNVNGPNGLTTYTQTKSTGLLQPFTANSDFLIFPCVNFYEGGCYDVNTDTLTMFSSVNGNLVNDSLFAPVTVCNSRPNNGGDYTLCLGDTIPNGDGLSILNCPTGLVQDSVLIPFNLTFTGNAPTPIPSSTLTTGAMQFGTATLPNLRPGANILSGEISVTNLFLPGPFTFFYRPADIRFSLFNNPTAPPVPIANINHQGLVGNANLSAFAAFDYLSTPSAADLNTMYTAGVPDTAAMTMGLWNTAYPTPVYQNAGVIVNSGNPTVATLKIIYEYIPQGISWWDQAAGGTRIIDTSLFNPLLTTNPVLNNSNTLGTYTFYGACEADTNCRVAVNVIVGGLDYTSVLDTSVQCNGDTTGSILATVSGGTPSSLGYLYRLYQGATPLDSNNTGYFSGLGAGVYRLNVLDSVGCSSGDSLVTISEPAALVIDTALVTDVLCHGASTGQLQVHAQGPAGVVYQNNLLPVGGQVSGSFSGLAANTYTVRASHSGGACFVDTTLTITEPLTAVGFASGSVDSVSCNGLSDGKIFVSGTGGTPGSPAGYTYAIIAPAGSVTTPSLVDSFINLGADTYTVRITDSNGCTHDTILIVSEPAQLVVSASGTTDVLCQGDSSGQIVMGYTGGTGILSYTISPQHTGVTQLPSGTFNNLPSDTYTLTGTDANGCIAVTTVTITEPSSSVSITSVTSTPPSCVPGCDATVTITATGGTVPSYNYQFGTTGPQGSSVFPNQCAGTFTATVTDANGCTATSQHTISAPGSPTWNPVSQINVSCNGNSNGSFTLSTSGGTGAATQMMTIPAVNPGTFTAPGNYTNMPAGNYTIQATDAAGCSILTIVTITEPAVFVVDTASVSDVPCNGDSTATIVMTSSGGTPTGLFPTYIIAPIFPGVTQSPVGTFNNVPAGTYTITGTDANNCVATTVVTVTQPSALSYASVSTADISCNGANDGTITAAGSGGVLPLNISLNPGPGASTASPANFTGLGGGAQTITITDGNACTLDSVVTINEPAVLSVSSGSGNTQVSCFGDSTGVIVMSSMGGTGALTYVITAPMPVPPTILQAPAGTFNNVPAGTYMIDGTDGNGCTASTTITISQPATGVDITSITGTTPTCTPGNDGTLTVAASGGTGVITLTLPPSTTVYPLPTITGLGSSTYIVRATDANGCFADTTYTISNSSAPTIDSTHSFITQCFDDSTGSMTVFATGSPQSSVTYAITAPAGFVTAPQASGNFTNLAAGTYTVTANDANNCPVSVAVVITEPTAVSIVSVVTDSVNCNGGSDGSIVVIGTGGTGSLVSNLPSVVAPSPAGTFTFNNLSATTYTVQLQDGNGCTVDSMIVVDEPSAVSISSLTSTDVLCNGDSTGGVIVTAIGGTGSKTYSINTTPVNTNPIGVFGNLGAGTYIVTATDAYQCSVTSSIVVAEPSALSQSNSVTNVSCFGGSDGEIIFTGAGGVGSFTYTLYPPVVNNATGIFPNLPAGTMYQNVLTDGNGCLDTSVMVTITEPTQVLFTSVAKTDIDCYGASTGSISAAASGGTGPVLISLNGAPGVPTPTTYSNVPAGIYTLTATDGNGCTSVATITVIENPRIFFSSITNTEETCFGDGKASITFQATGGKGDFLYLFDNQLPASGQTTYTGLTTRTYPIRATDSLGCVHDTTYTLTGPEPIMFTEFEIVPTTCLDTDDGKLTVTATGGRGSFYDYTLEPGLYVNTNGIFRDLAAQAYVLRVMDTAGCFIDTNVTVPLPSNPIVVSITKEDLGCHGRGNEGTATANVNGGTPPYTYLWSSTPVQTTASVIGLYQGIHTVDVVDAQGCLVRDTFVIQPGPCCQEVFLPNAFSPNGDGLNDEFRILSTAGMELNQFEVYNRWGIRIWQTRNSRQSWDGQYGGEPVDIGTYHYVLRYRCLTDGQNYTKKGDIMVVR